MSELPVGVVGLGRVGRQLSENLVADGHQVVGYDHGDGDGPDGVDRVTSASELAHNCEVAFSCLPHGRALRESADELAEDPGRLRVFVDLSTSALSDKQAVRACLDTAGVTVLDAPVVGMPAMMRERRGLVLASGDRTAYDRVQSLLQTLGRTRLVGDFGAGSRLKFVADALVAVHITAAAEAVALARALHLDAAEAVELLGDSAAGSAALASRGPTMATQRTFGPGDGTIDLMRDALDAVEEAREQAGAITPMLDAARRTFDSAEARGLGHRDVAAIVVALTAQPSAAGRPDGENTQEGSDAPQP